MSVKTVIFVVPCFGLPILLTYVSSTLTVNVKIYVGINELRIFFKIGSIGNYNLNILYIN